MGLAPALSSHDLADLLLADAELDRKLALPDGTEPPARPQLGDVRPGQLAHPVVLPGVVREDEASLGDCVAHVLRTSARPPVCIVLAGAEVALVADLQVGCNRPHAKHVTEAMSVNHSGRPVLPARSVPEEAISPEFGVTRKLAACTSPRPALAWSADVHLGPVPLGDGDTHNLMLYKDDLGRRGLSLDDYDDDVISV